jgi:hypothetical protein
MDQGLFARSRTYEQETSVILWLSPKKEQPHPQGASIFARFEPTARRIEVGGGSANSVTSVVSSDRRQHLISITDG